MTSLRICGNMRNDSGHVVWRFDQSASFRIFDSAFYFPHSAFYPQPSNESVVVENGDFCFFRLLSSEHITYMATRQLSRDAVVDDLGDISRSLNCFTSNFSKNSAWYGKSYCRPLIVNHTLAFDWCHFWWPWSTFEGHFSLGCHFHVRFSNPWHAFASHGLPAIAELLVVISCWVYVVE